MCLSSFTNVQFVVDSKNLDITNKVLVSSQLQTVSC